MSLILYLSIGFVGWLLVAFLMSRDGNMEATEFVGGLIMCTVFWPLAICGVCLVGVFSFLHWLVIELPNRS